MTLYLLRHGEAENYSSSGDRARVLTEKGITQSWVAGKYLQDKYPDVVLLSTYTRAKQTLEQVNQSRGSCSLREFISMDVAPGGSIDDLMVEIQQYKKEDSILIVGHNPQLSRLVYQITGEEKMMGNCSYAEIDLESKKLLEFTTVEDMVCTN